MRKNDRVVLTITGVTAEGLGVGRYENMAVFVPNSAIGDVANVLIVKVLKKYCFGKIIDFIKQSDHRIEPDCPVFSQCGGCSYRHISYAAECDIKYQRVLDVISRIAKSEAEVLPIMGSDRLDGYRNKAQYPVGNSDNGIYTGFYALHSHRIVKCDDCKLQPTEFKDILDVIRNYAHKNGVSAYDEALNSGVLRHIYIRKAEKTNQLMVCLVINGERLPNENDLCHSLIKANENIKSIVVNINQNKTNVILGEKCRTLYGDDHITDILCDVKVKLSPLSFYQVNRNMAQQLYKVAAEFAQPRGKTVLDLYCGAGTIGLSMACLAKQIIGVEIVPEAIEDAKFNAKANGIENAEFYCGDALFAAKQLAQKDIHPDVVVLDPPRKGIDSQLVDIITDEFAPERVVYVSCDPATLARDIFLFEQKGYKAIKVQPVDLFPRTPHVESVALLTKSRH